MLSIVDSFGLFGINGYKVSVEVDINKGLPTYDVVGLADTAIKESKQRIRSAIKNSGLDYPVNKITINLAPADTKKEGSLYDLPIAIGILTATGQAILKNIKDYAFIGELSLDGSIRKINGVLPILISARTIGIKNIFIPHDNMKEASYIEGINIYAVKTLREVVDFINRNLVVLPTEKTSFEVIKNQNVSSFDFSLIKGQASAKRAMEISAAGGHNLLMIGPPGSGKTMLARSYPTILPDMTFEEALEVTKIHSIAGTLDNKLGFVATRPFRSPHHTATTIALTGGGRDARPGEISLAHNGVLFLDEMPEHSRNTIEALRQPLEDGVITVSRNAMTIEYPANFVLLASMNPCPCGNYGSRNRECKCSATQIHKYLARLSGPLMDRIDLHVEVDSVTYDELNMETYQEESSETIRERVSKAREVALERFKGTNIYCNAKMTNAMVKKHCKISQEANNILAKAFDKLNLSARAYNRIIKVARTIADLEDSKEIKTEHIIEAIGYRSLDDKYWV